MAGMVETPVAPLTGEILPAAAIPSERLALTTLVVNGTAADHLLAKGLSGSYADSPVQGLASGQSGD